MTTRKNSVPDPDDGDAQACCIGVGCWLSGKSIVYRPKQTKINHPKNFKRTEKKYERIFNVTTHTKWRKKDKLLFVIVLATTTATVVGVVVFAAAVITGCCLLHFMVSVVTKTNNCNS